MGANVSGCRPQRRDGRSPVRQAMRDAPAPMGANVSECRPQRRDGRSPVRQAVRDAPAPMGANVSGCRTQRRDGRSPGRQAMRDVPAPLGATYRLVFMTPGPHRHPGETGRIFTPSSWSGGREDPPGAAGGHGDLGCRDRPRNPRVCLNLAGGSAWQTAKVIQEHGQTSKIGAR